MAVKYRELRPMLWTVDVPASIEFYREILGFELDEYNEEWNWASLSKDAASLMLAKPAAQEKFQKIGFTGSFYFNIDDVDALWEELQGKVEVCYEPVNFPWEMREFAIYDNNGYLLQFGQNLEHDKEILP